MVWTSLNPDITHCVRNSLSKILIFSSAIGIKRLVPIRDTSDSTVRDVCLHRSTLDLETRLAFGDQQTEFSQNNFLTSTESEYTLRDV